LNLRHLSRLLFVTLYQYYTIMGICGQPGYFARFFGVVFLPQ